MSGCFRIIPMPVFAQKCQHCKSMHCLARYQHMHFLVHILLSYNESFLMLIQLFLQSSNAFLAASSVLCSALFCASYLATCYLSQAIMLYSAVTGECLASLPSGRGVVTTAGSIYDCNLSPYKTISSCEISANVM